MLLPDYIKHLRDREYMSGIERDKLRVKNTGEVFTPTPLVQEVLDNLDHLLFKDTTKTFIDPSCGDGQFLSEVVIRKLENGHTLEQALSTTYGVDLMADNVLLTRERLLCGQEQFRHIVERNIICHDALTYEYKFKKRQTTSQLLKISTKQEKQRIKDELEARLKQTISLD